MRPLRLGTPSDSPYVRPQWLGACWCSETWFNKVHATDPIGQFRTWGEQENEEQATYPSTHPSITHPLIHPALLYMPGPVPRGPQEWNQHPCFMGVTPGGRQTLKPLTGQLMTFLTVHLVQAWGLEKHPLGEGTFAVVRKRERTRNSLRRQNHVSTPRSQPLAWCLCESV